MKTEVYSWGISTALKTDLENEARRRKMPISAVLEAAVQQLLKRESEGDEDAEQLRLHAAASQCLGAFAGGDAHRSENARRVLRERLKQRHGR